MNLLSSNCKTYVIHLVGEQGVFRAAIARFLLVYERFCWQLFIKSLSYNLFRGALTRLPL